MKIFIYRMSLMNGTVTMNTEVAAFASRELAEETREAVRRYNAQHNPNARVHYSDIEEINVYESKGEIPFFQTEEGKNLSEVMKSEPVEQPAGLGDILFVGTKDAMDDYLKKVKEGRLGISERRPAWETSESWNALDYETVKRLFTIEYDEDAAPWQIDIIYNIVRMYSGILTAEKTIGMASDKQLRTKYDEDLNALVESMQKTWVNYMPPMYFADHHPKVSIDWRNYVNDREHGKIIVTFKVVGIH